MQLAAPASVTSAAVSAESATAQAIAPGLLEALRLAKAAYREQPVPSLAQRRADLLTLRRFIKEQQTALCDAVNADYGQRSVHETMLTEIIPSLQAVDHALKHLRSWMRVQRRAVDWLSYFGGRNRVIPQPLGVVGVIVPWNFPINLSMVPLVCLLAAGNRVMVKMSENSRHLARLLITQMPHYFAVDKLQFFDETGGVGAQFSRLPFDHLLFTGSAHTGRKVMQAAAQNLCPVTLELGGKAPAIVSANFPLELAAQRILFIKYLNAGQICTTVDHVWLPQARLNEFVQLAQTIVPQRYSRMDSPDYTAIIDERAFNRLLSWLDEARARGAKVVQLVPGAPFDRATRKIAPHLVYDAPPDCQLAQQEIFGPILWLRTYSQLSEVLQHINSGPRPLAIYPFSDDKQEVQHIVDNTLSGGVTVNDALLHVGQHDLPFGGVGESGMGHYHGREGFETFSKMRPVFYQTRFSTLKLLFPPYGKWADWVMAFLSR